MNAPAELLVSRCTHCHGRFLPRPGPCPRCGSVRVVPHPLPGVGTVLAAAELMVPPTGWSSPHRLALVELSEGVRVLALVQGELPAIGERATISRDQERYLASRVPAGEDRRGEGDVPAAGRSRPPFEPPR